MGGAGSHCQRFSNGKQGSAGGGGARFETRNIFACEDVGGWPSVPASLERGLLQDRFEGWLYVFRDVLDEERPPDPDAVLQRP